MYFTYIATNKNNTVLYAGITNNLERRIYEHSNKLTKGFTVKYNVKKLVWYEQFQTAYDAISAEKKIKGWKRDKKVALIKSINPEFRDLLN